jgi:hypothetical protein
LPLLGFRPASKQRQFSPLHGFTSTVSPCFLTHARRCTSQMQFTGAPTPLLPSPRSPLSHLCSLFSTVCVPSVPSVAVSQCVAVCRSVSNIPVSPASHADSPFLSSLCGYRGEFQPKGFVPLRPIFRQPYVTVSRHPGTPALNCLRLPSDACRGSWASPYERRKKNISLLLRNLPESIRPSLDSAAPLNRSGNCRGPF